ncbi:DUF3037 domain-containing protein [Nioella ostreopsis]|uniref:DUF3037 domain-containing protein n=1 Tax=Nioella ostreopsis TaxID=2448479 RepID=UPI000FDA675E|nr:DUF3037 domain-containing protein [Nioella ostreopsis]
MKLMPYTFVVLQYQHSPFAGERLNIGLLLVCEGRSFAQLKIRDSWKRFSDAYPDFDRNAVKSDLKALSVAASRIAKEGFSAPLDTKLWCSTAEGLLLRLFGTPEGSIVWSSQGAGVTHDPEEELEKLHSQLIARFDHVSSHDRRDDDDVFQSLKSHLDDTHLLAQMTEHVVHSPRGDVRFKRSFKNGIWHCVQPLSFDHTDRDTIDSKAARWAGHLMQAEEADENFQPYFIIGKPSNPSFLSAFESAENLLSSAPRNPIVVREEDSETIADRLLHAFQN